MGEEKEKSYTPKSYELMYPNLPPLPAKRPSRKAASLFWGLGIWKKEWGDPPWVIPPRERPPPEFEEVIAELGFWRDDWGPSPLEKEREE